MTRFFARSIGTCMKRTPNSKVRGPPTPTGAFDLHNHCEYFPFSFVIALSCRYEYKGYA